MNVDVKTETVIDRPRSDVAAYAVDPANATEWYANITRSEMKTPPPLTVGSKIAFEARFLGRTLAYTYEVIEHVPDERFVMRTSEGPFQMETTYEWADAPPGRTTMRLRNRGTPSGFARIAAPMMVKAMLRANTKDLERIKQILERADRPD